MLLVLLVVSVVVLLLWTYRWFRSSFDFTNRTFNAKPGLLMTWLVFNQ
jgi:hypothetical protein